MTPFKYPPPLPSKLQETFFNSVKRVQLLTSFYSSPYPVRRKKSQSFENKWLGIKKPTQ